jgi:hypothetical protein
VMFTDPGFLVPQSIEELHDFEIALYRRNRILTGRRVERGHENAKTHEDPPMVGRNG